jgi:CubicO group peptidase (beta-lactamase class C family)
MIIRTFVFILILSGPLLTGATQGPNRALIEKSLSAIEKGAYTDIDSVLLYQNNRLIIESYFNGFSADQIHQTRSTFKSITGLLAAIAFDKKLLEPNELVLPLISRYSHSKNIDPRKSKMKVSDLLNMTSGFDCSEMPGTGPYHDDAVDNGPTPLKYSLAMPMSTEPGTEWKYCNSNSFLLGVSISAALDRAKLPNIDHFARKYLFEPLAIKNYRTYTSPEGFLYAQGNARFLPRDLAKIGLTILNNGQWNGQQIISEHHAKSIINGIVDAHWSWTDLIKGHPSLNARYAYQWHLTQFAIGEKLISTSHSWGNGGQFIFVIPDSDAVVVFTGSNYNDIEKQKQAFEIMHQYLLPALSSNEL